MPILGHQGPGSITEITIRRLLTLQGAMRPDQIISLMKFEGAGNTIAMADHADHIHVGFQPPFGVRGELGQPVAAVLKPDQWGRLTNRINAIYRPDRPTQRLNAAGEALSPALPRLKTVAPARAREIALRLELQDRPTAIVAARDDAGDEPSIEVKPLVVEPGDRLTVKGSGWSCEDDPDDELEVTITLGEDGEKLGEAEPDDDGEFEVRVELARDLLPDDLETPTEFVIFAEAECAEGKDLSTGKNSPAILVVEDAPSDDDDDSDNRDRDRDDSGDGNDGDDGDSDDDGDGGDDGEGDEQPEPPELVSAPEDVESGQPDDGAEQEVLGATEESDDDDGSDSDGDDDSDDDDSDSDKNKKDRGGGGDKAGDDDDGGGKRKRVSVPRKAAPLISAAQAARSPAVTGWPPPKFPEPAPWYLFVAIVLILAGLALLGIPALATFAGSLLTPSKPPDAAARTDELPRIRPTDL
jgi:hypothetical protein